MRGLPPFGRSLDEPVCWNMFHSREMVLWLTFRVRATSFCECPAWRRPITKFRVAAFQFNDNSQASNLVLLEALV